jgi:2-polyprenylphenol 6-hydroxylase
MKTIETDIIVVGAGLVGLSAAIAFAKQGKSVVLVDAKPAMNQKMQAWDARIYAITLGNERWLIAQGVWKNLDASRVSAIDAMHVWSGSGEELVLHCEDASLPKLGVILENQNLMQALLQQVHELGVMVIPDSNCAFLENDEQHISLHLLNKSKIEAKTKIIAKLIVAADGVNSWVRNQMKIELKKKSFNQTAIVANFMIEKSHENIARQWFAPHETLALLPLVGKNASLVWSVSTERAEELLKLSGADLSRAVEEKSKQVLGAMKIAGKALPFILNQQAATNLIAERVVLVGDAAHQIHPMAGQGVNLGFRDVMQLTSLATNLHSMQDLGDAAFLRQYARARKADMLAMNTLTTGLDALFASDSRMLKQLTSWGLRQLNRKASVKKLLILQAAA